MSLSEGCTCFAIGQPWYCHSRACPIRTGTAAAVVEQASMAEPPVPAPTPGPENRVPNPAVTVVEGTEIAVAPLGTDPADRSQWRPLGVAVSGDLAVLPYPDERAGASSGWSGSETSRERAEHADADGTTTARQQQVLRYLATAAEQGVTWKELVEAYPALFPHHGSASGVLSNLHKAGKITRVTERRQRCQIYVLPQCAAGRTTVAQGQRRARVTLDHVTDVAHSHEPLSHVVTPGMPLPPVCSCGDDGDYTAHLLAEIAKGAR